jgi:serine/threonine protein kinase
MPGAIISAVAEEDAVVHHLVENGDRVFAEELDVVDVAADGSDLIAASEDVIVDNECPAMVIDGNIVSFFSGDEVKVQVASTPPIRFHQYRRGRELGSGASGQVYACSHRMGGDFAVKTIDLRRMRLSATAERERKKLGREIAILKSLPPHEHVVQLIDAFDEGGWMMLVLELVGGGDLYSAVTCRSPTRFLEPETAYVTRQLADGLRFLHGQNVIHRDVKLENILVASEHRQGDFVFYEVKIADFGLSIEVGVGFSQAKSRVGTLPYAAPEVRRGQPYGFSSDLWGLGVVLYILLAGRFPFNQTSVKDDDLMRSAGHLHNVSLVGVSVVYGLLDLLPDKRLDLDALIQHKWLRTGGKRQERADGAVVSAKRARHGDTDAV